MMRGSPKRWISCLLILMPFVRVAAASDLRLLEAIKNHNKQAVPMLLRQHAEVNSRDGDGSTALHWAAHWNEMDAADLLIRAGANVNAATDLGVTPLFLACENGNGTMVERLLRAGAKAQATLSTGESVLMTCARTGNLESVKTLLAHGANVNAKENSHDQTALLWAVSQQHPNVVKVLIDNGADVHARSRVYPEFVTRRLSSAKGPKGVWIKRGGSTPLLIASRVGNIDSARVLLAAGADIYETAPDGNSALTIAAHSGHGTFAVFLLEHGADPNAAGIGYTALHSAVLKGDVNLVRALLAHGANPDARLVNGTPIRRTDPDPLLPEELAGATPYLLAARYLNTEIMRVLAAGGANRFLPMNDGTTPLMAAAGAAWDSGQGGGSGGFSRQGVYIVGDVVSDESAALEATKLAIEQGGDVMAANQDGDTALHGAAEKGYTSVVQLLVDSGAKLDVKNRAGYTPLALAERAKRQRTADLLAKLGARQ